MNSLLNGVLLHGPQAAAIDIRLMGQFLSLQQIYSRTSCASSMENITDLINCRSLSPYKYLCIRDPHVPFTVTGQQRWNPLLVLVLLPSISLSWSLCSIASQAERFHALFSPLRMGNKCEYSTHVFNRVQFQQLPRWVKR
jgi:hypothetical protein